MAKYAVIKVKGTQFKVKEGDEILVGKMVENEKLEVQILLLVNGDKVTVGKSLVKNAKVDLKVINSEEKGKKLYVQKYKAKSRYRRKYGFRPVFTRIKVGKITQ